MCTLPSSAGKARLHRWPTLHCGDTTALQPTMSIILTRTRWGLAAPLDFIRCACESRERFDGGGLKSGPGGRNGDVSPGECPQQSIPMGPGKTVRTRRSMTLQIRAERVSLSGRVAYYSGPKYSLPSVVAQNLAISELQLGPERLVSDGRQDRSQHRRLRTDGVRQGKSRLGMIPSFSRLRIARF